jgi:hypothetical protein
MSSRTHARELKLTEEDVRQEHLQAVSARRHWLYLVGVLGGAFVLMLAIMVLLEGAAG